MALNAFSGCISDLLSTIEDSAAVQLERACVTPDELASINAIKALGLIGYPTQLMEASKTPESAIIDVLGHSASFNGLE